MKASKWLVCFFHAWRNLGFFYAHFYGRRYRPWLTESKEKLSTLKTAAEQANTALANGDISQEQYDALQREIIETEQDLKKLETQAN